MDGATLAVPQSESDISETTATSGDKLEITSPELALGIAFYEPESIKEIIVTGTLEFIPGKDRGAFFEQCYRVLVPYDQTLNVGKMTVTVPYWTSWRAYYDSRFEWPPFCEQTFLCYNKSWRETNVKGLELECDFDFDYGYAWEAETVARNDESRVFWTKHYCNSVDALQLTFKKRAKS